MPHFKPMIKGRVRRERLLEAARRQPGMNFVAVARELGCDPSTAAYHARRLEHAGALRIRDGGRQRRLYAVPLILRGLPHPLGARA